MIVACDQNGIRLAIRTIKDGGIVVFPTDTVYGIGCNPYDKTAVDKIFSLKGRAKTKNLPILGYSKNDISDIAIFDSLSEKIAKKFWPGPITLVLKVKNKKIAESLCLEDKVAVRVPNHPCVNAILKECKIIVGTSANFSGQKSLCDSKEVADKFRGYDLMLDGGLILGVGESTIVEVTDTRVQILREGRIESEFISKFESNSNL